MLNAFAQLTRCQDNEILDNLRYLIAERRMPTSILADTAHSVVVINTTDGKQWCFEIAPGWFIDYWEDARAVLATLPELPQMTELSHPVYDRFGEERRRCADDIRRWKETHNANG